MERARQEVKPKSGKKPPNLRGILMISQEVETMTAEKDILRQHIKSMNERLKCLEKMAGGGDSVGGGEEDEVSLKIQEMNDQVSRPWLYKC